ADSYRGGGWAHNSAVKTSGSHRRQNLRGAAHLQDVYLAVSLEPPLLERQPQRETRSRAESADADFFSAQIVRFVDSFGGDNGKEGRIDQAGNDHRIDSG